MIIWTVTLSLASWRVTSLLHTESMFDWLRKWIGIQQNDSQDTYSWFYPDTFLGHIFGCFWCLSLWISWLLSILTMPFLRWQWYEWIALWWASAAGAIIVEKWIGRSKARW